MRKSGQQLERIGRKIQFMIDKICKLKYNMDAGKKGPAFILGKEIHRKCMIMKEARSYLRSKNRLV